MPKPGTIVRSLDSRDDPDLFYVVLNADIAHVSGPVCQIALCGEEERRYYRLSQSLVDATDELAQLVRETEETTNA